MRLVLYANWINTRSTKPLLRVRIAPGSPVGISFNGRTNDFESFNRDSISLIPAKFYIKFDNLLFNGILLLKRNILNMNVKNDFSKTFNFFDLSEEEINKGISYCFDSKLLELGLQQNDPLTVFAMDSSYLKLVDIWLKCDKNMLMTKLSVN